MSRTLQLLHALAPSRAALAPVASAAASVQGASLAVPSLASAAAVRSLRCSATRLGFGSHVSDNNPFVLELEKKRNLSKDKKIPGGGGVPDVEGWNELLASDSEAVVRPRRGQCIDAPHRMCLSLAGAGCRVARPQPLRMRECVAAGF